MSLKLKKFMRDATRVQSLGYIVDTKSSPTYLYEPRITRDGEFAIRKCRYQRSRDTVIGVESVQKFTEADTLVKYFQELKSQKGMIWYEARLRPSYI